MLDKNSPFLTSAGKRSESLSGLCQEVLAAAILEGDPAPGSIVSEVEMSTRFSIGVAAVRTALARLSVMGWVEAKGRRGWTVQPMSPAHLADLRASRRYLEVALPGSPCPKPLSAELMLQADIHQGAVHTSAPHTLLHQERKLLALIAQGVAAPRLRGWLTDTWDLSLRADFFLGRHMGIMRPPLPLANLARAVGSVNTAEAAAILLAMRTDFDARIDHAFSRSEGAILNVTPPRAEKDKHSTDTTAFGRLARATKGNQA